MISTGRGFNVNVQSILGVKGTNVVTVRDDISLADAASILRDKRVGALVVSNDGQHIDGIISERDVVRALANHGASVLGRPVSSAMSTDVVTCRAGDAVESLMVSMTERRIRHLPVVDDDAVLGGVISIGDVVKARLGQLETENQQLYEYITQGGSPKGEAPSLEPPISELARPAEPSAPHRNRLPPSAAPRREEEPRLPLPRRSRWRGRRRRPHQFGSLGCCSAAGLMSLASWRSASPA